MDLAKIENVMIKGDLSTLSDAERVSYYSRVCESVGLNHLTQPLAYIQLNGKLKLYALKDATDQLRKIHGVSISIKETKKLDDLYIVVVEAQDKTGRKDSSTGAVSLKGLHGDSLANAIMKSETKAKRRVTLSICGLGLLDETEVEDIPREKTVNPENQWLAKLRENLATIKDGELERIDKALEYWHKQSKHVGPEILEAGLSLIDQKAKELKEKPVLEAV